MYGNWVESRALAVARVLVVFERLLARLGREEGGEVGVLAVRQADEAEVGELILATFGDDHLGRALVGDLAHGR